MIKLWQKEEIWNLYRNPWPGSPVWVVFGLLADWACAVDDNGSLFPIEYSKQEDIV